MRSWGEREVSGGELMDPITVTTEELRERSPVFMDAAKAYVDEQNTPFGAHDLDSLIACSASLEGATKTTWSNPGEEFVGYKET
ncbi:hypothetical protein R1sor_024092 [Riccia sorocarpa]|uniref:Uncharacterized protein n=1 Tax=Riccia sorocarpa TaxID=122646 RepID=A0ABD3GRC0_9MARC